MIKPYDFYCQHVLPLVLDESLSYYQILCQIKYKLNEIINSENKLQEAFENLLNWVNTQLEQYTKEQLQKWYDEGYFDEIIKKWLDEFTVKFTEEINKTNSNVTKNTKDIENIKNEIVNLGFYNNYSMVLNYCNNNNNEMGQQGACKISDNVYMFGYSMYADQSQSKIVEINIATNTILRQVNVTCGHINSITYNEALNELYIAPIFSNDATKIITLNYTDLSLKSTTSLGVNVHWVSYNKETNEYAVGAGSVMHVCSEGFRSIIKTISLNANFPTSTIYQTGYLYKSNTYLITYSPNILYIFDSDGNQTSALDLDSNNALGECEAVWVENDVIYFAGGFVDNLYELTCVYKMTKKGSPEEIINLTNYSNTIYVDTTKTDFTGIGVQNKPYTNIFAAMLNSFKHKTSYKINITGNIPRFTCNKASLQITGESGTTFNGIDMAHSDVTFFGIRFVCPTESGYTIQNSRVAFYNPVFVSSTVAMAFRINSSSQITIVDLSTEGTNFAEEYMYIYDSVCTFSGSGSAKFISGNVNSIIGGFNVQSNLTKINGSIVGAELNYSFRASPTTVGQVYTASGQVPVNKIASLKTAIFTGNYNGKISSSTFNIFYGSVNRTNILTICNPNGEYVNVFGNFSVNTPEITYTITDIISYTIVDGNIKPTSVTTLPSGYSISNVQLYTY